MSAANNAAFIWSIANLLRGRTSPPSTAPVILPFTVLQRLDCMLEANYIEGLSLNVRDIFETLRLRGGDRPSSMNMICRTW